ncbi:MAG: hypothetical protein NZ921_02395 [Candidatus Caldarchaeum sp.]|nr:hypothetical protein [Candidatus Caldarchaeum sp.]
MIDELRELTEPGMRGSEAVVEWRKLGEIVVDASVAVKFFDWSLCVPPVIMGLTL